MRSMFHKNALTVCFKAPESWLVLASTGEKCYIKEHSKIVRHYSFIFIALWCILRLWYILKVRDDCYDLCELRHSQRWLKQNKTSKICKCLYLLWLLNCCVLSNANNNNSSAISAVSTGLWLTCHLRLESTMTLLLKVDTGQTSWGLSRSSAREDLM